MIDRFVARFSRWFASSGAVWQTTAIVFAWVALEIADPTLDPHGFLVLYVLTVYSAITQPALAYASNASAVASQRALEAQTLILRNQAHAARALRAMMERMDARTAEIAEDVGEIHAEVIEGLEELEGRDTARGVREDARDQRDADRDAGRWGA